VSLKRLRIHADARTELLRETLYYETHRTGTGKRFREAVAAAFGVLRHFPASGAIGPSGTRKLKVKGFPFAVIYRDDPSEIIVFAIVHHRKLPNYWLARQ
jgi:plasmid stabilization system protein ParE